MTIAIDQATPKRGPIRHYCELRVVLAEMRKVDEELGAARLYDKMRLFLGADPARADHRAGPRSRAGLLVSIPHDAIRMPKTFEAVIAWATNVYARAPEHLENLDALLRHYGDEDGRVVVHEATVNAAIRRDGYGSSTHARSLARLAGLLASRRAFEPAAAKYAEAHGCFVKLYGANDPRAAKASLGRAASLRARGDDDEAAKAAAREAMTACDACGDDALGAAAAFELGSCLRTAGATREAEIHYRRALRVYDKGTSRETLEQARTVFGLAASLKLDAAAAARVEATELFARAVGAFDALNDPQRAALASQGLANALRLNGEADLARPHQARAAAALQKALASPEHPYRWAVRKLCEQINAAPEPTPKERRARETERALRENLKLVAEALGPDHLEAAEASSALADFLRATGRLDEAVALYKKALGARAARRNATARRRRRRRRR